MFILMILNLLFSVILFVIGITNIDSSGSAVKTGYSDIGGYQNGSWIDMLAFPLLAVILGIFHNLVATRIFKKRGAGMTKFFLIATTALIFGTGIVLLRLLEKV